MRPDLLEVSGLVKTFRVGGGVFSTSATSLRAVDGVSFRVGYGDTLGIVGESGCGKSTLARLILQLTPVTEGSVRLEGEELVGLGRREMIRQRRKIQIVFQDTYGTLNGRMSAADVVAEPIRNFRLADGAALTARVARLLDLVGLPKDSAGKFPHQFSGGQRQRLGIARALAVEPKLVVCDEPVSALDVSVQAQILNLLKDLQRELKLSYVFIAHDLAVVRHVSRELAVMYLGRIVEIGEAGAIFAAPAHPYTKGLISSVPSSAGTGEGPRELLAGDVPSPMSPPTGCGFHTRCPQAMERCRSEAPPLRQVAAGRFSACHLHETAVTQF